MVVNGLEIPFRFEIAGNGSQVSGWFFNGDEKVLSASGVRERIAGPQVRSLRHVGRSDARQRTVGRYYNRATGFYPFYAQRLRTAGSVSE